jgi:predicted RNase H-like HicB family nuclease
VIDLHDLTHAVLGFGYEKRFSASIWQEGEWFIAQCVQVDVASQGATEDEALKNLRDALQLHFTPAVATQSSKK